MQEWNGTAMGSAARIVLSGATAEKAARVFRKVEAILLQVERQFSLHRDSDLTRLNRNGWLSHPAAEIQALFDLADQVHAATGGAFDPTVQPLWLATATGGDTVAASGLGRLDPRAPERTPKSGSNLACNSPSTASHRAMPQTAWQP